MSSFTVLFVLGTLWSLASPLFSVPDESSHVIRAASVVRGELIGVAVRDPEGRDVTRVTVPEILARTPELPACYRAQPRVPADCAPALTGGKGDTPVLIGQGRYPPLYYLAVGWPSLLFESALGVRLMRLVSVVLSSALLASAFCCAWESRYRRVAVSALVVALTPMTLYLVGSVNPNGFEIAAAIGTWSALAALLQSEPGSRERRIRLVRRAAVAGCCLAASRPASLLTVAVVGVSFLALARADTRSDLFHDPTVRIWALGSAIVMALCGVWVLAASALGGYLGIPVPDDVSTLEIVRVSLGKTEGNIREMIGVFGSLETHSPLATLAVWLAAVSFLALVALAVARRRERTVLIALVGLTLLVPVVLEASQARVIGYGWQGRYALPLAVGIPILAGVVGASRLHDIGGPLVGPFLGLAALGHVLAFAWALRRFALGGNALSGPIHWQPPLTAPVLMLACIAAGAAFAWTTMRLAGPARVAGLPPEDAPLGSSPVTR